MVSFTDENPCPHEDFTADVAVNRLQDGQDVTTGYSADIRVRCVECEERFVWVGLPFGLRPDAPTVSVDGFEMRAPLRPESAPEDYGFDSPGFTIRVKS